MKYFNFLNFLKKRDAAHRRKRGREAFDVELRQVIYAAELLDRIFFLQAADNSPASKPEKTPNTIVAKLPQIGIKELWYDGDKMDFIYCELIDVKEANNYDQTSN